MQVALVRVRVREAEYQDDEGNGGALEHCSTLKMSLSTAPGLLDNSAWLSLQ